MATLERVVAVSFAFPEEVLRAIVPDGLEIDAYEGLGFVTVALVWTRDLPPAGFPVLLGQDFFLAGYRVFTRLRDESGRRLRGNSDNVVGVMIPLSLPDAVKMFDAPHDPLSLCNDR